MRGVGLIRKPTEHCRQRRLDCVASRLVIVCYRRENEGAEVEIGEVAAGALPSDSHLLNGAANCLWPKFAFIVSDRAIRKYP